MTAVSAPRLRPLRVGEIIDVAIKVCTRNFATLVKLVAIVVVPVQILGALVALSTMPDELLTPAAPPLDPTTGPIIDPTDMWAGVAGALLVGILSFIATTLATGACFRAVGEAYLGHTPDWKESLDFARRRLGSLVWISLLVTLFTALGILACLIPGIWLYISWTVAVPAFLSEDEKGMGALRRSFRLVKGRWWPTFAVVALAFLLVSIVSGIVGALVVPVMFVGGDEPVLVQLVTSLANTIGAILTMPFQVAVASLVYFDLRVRKEGFDIELLARGIGVEPSRAPVGPAAGPAGFAPGPWAPPAAGRSPGRPPPPPPPRSEPPERLE